jgi:hypothetical protein
VVFRLFSEDEVEPLLSDNEVISLEDYTIDAAGIISLAMDRCTSLVVEVESHELLEDILLSLTDTAPLHLNAFVVSFGIKDYAHFRPFGVQEFKWSTPIPLGQPFPAFNTLSWTTASVTSPTVTFLAYTCSVVHPSSRPVVWDDVTSAIGSSPQLQTLILDGLHFDFRPGAITCSRPMSSVRNLEVAFRGDHHMGYMVSRLNLPAVQSLKFIITTFGDIHCMCTCAALLSQVTQLTLEGFCRSGPDVHSIFSLMRYVSELDLRGVGNLFFSALADASRRPRYPTGPNWNACPSLKRLLVHGIALAELRSLVLTRRASEYVELEYVMVSAPRGGRDVSVISWFRSEGIELAAVVFGP